MNTNDANDTMRDTIADTAEDRLQLLVLARLCTRAKKLSTSEVSKSLSRYLERTWTVPEQRQAMERTFAGLTERGDIERKPLAITERGRVRLRERLGCQDKDLEWNRLRKNHLTADALALPLSDKLRQRIANADGLRASILWRRHDLGFEKPPTLTQALDALVWRQLGIETSAPLTLNKLREHFLNQHFDTRRPLALDKLEKLLAARAAASERTEPDSLRAGLLQGWLFGAQGVAAAAIAAVPAKPSRSPDDARPEPSRRAPVDLHALAREVNRIAATVTDSGRFGERKVFISAIWRRIEGQPVCQGMSLGEFKTLLVRANREDLVWLHRADLIPLMPMDEVLASEIEHENATFHFVEIQNQGAES